MCTYIRRRRVCCTKELRVTGVEQFPGELDGSPAANLRLRRLLQLTEEQARAAANDQATVIGTPESPVSMSSSPAAHERVCGRPRNDEHMRRVDSVDSGLLGGGGSPAQRVCSAALVTVGAKAWECR
jgi:hypothetical protein